MINNNNNKCPSFLIPVCAIVEYEYAAKEPDELDLQKGAIIHRIKQMPGGWWQGTPESAAMATEPLAVGTTSTSQQLC